MHRRPANLRMLLIAIAWAPAACFCLQGATTSAAQRHDGSSIRLTAEQRKGIIEELRPSLSKQQIDELNTLSDADLLDLYKNAGEVTSAAAAPGENPGKPPAGPAIRIVNSTHESATLSLDYRTEFCWNRRLSIRAQDAVDLRLCMAPVYVKFEGNPSSAPQARLSGSGCYAVRQYDNPLRLALDRC